MFMNEGGMIVCIYLLYCLKKNKFKKSGIRPPNLYLCYLFVTREKTEGSRTRPDPRLAQLSWKREAGAWSVFWYKLIWHTVQRARGCAKLPASVNLSCGILLCIYTRMSSLKPSHRVGALFIPQCRLSYRNHRESLGCAKYQPGWPLVIWWW